MHTPLAFFGFVHPLTEHSVPLMDNRVSQKQPKLKRAYTFAWLAWIALFGVIEWKAIATKEPGASLSSHIWKLMGKREYQKQGAYLVWRIAVGGLLGWLIFHFFGKA